MKRTKELTNNKGITLVAISIILIVGLFIIVGVVILIMNTTKNEEDVPKENFEAVTNTVENSTITEEEDEEIPEFEYKMAYIGEKDIESEYTYSEPQHRVSYAIQTFAENYEISNFSVKVMDKATNQPTDIRYEFYEGSVCKKDGYHKVEENSTENDYCLGTLVLYPEGEFDPESIYVTARVKYNSDNSYVSPKEMEFQINADIEEITTQQSYVHNNNLLKINDGYYLVRLDSVEKQSEQSVGNTYSVEKYLFMCLAGNPEEDFKDVVENIKAVNLDGKEINDFGRLSLYCTYNVKKEKLLFGLQSADDDEGLNEEELVLSEKIYPKLVMDDGSTEMIIRPGGNGYEE